VNLAVNGERLLQRLEELAEIGAIVGADGDRGSARLALTAEDGQGRDLVVKWMRDLGLDISIDGVGNVIATMPHPSGLSPVMTGSHIDTVATGGRFDGNLGVLAGLEVIESVMSAGVELDRPLAVGFFTDEEGARFPPDMLGSLVYAGGMTVEEALDIRAVDGARFGEELEAIGYAGGAPSPGPAPHAFVELHIEQGPVLEVEDIQIGAVTGVQGISWTKVTLRGQSNHAGTTPMSMRKDPAAAMFAIGAELQRIVERVGEPQVGTIGRVELVPNLVNVVPASATFTVDVRHTDDEILISVEREVGALIEEVAAQHGLLVETESLARFAPVVFDDRVVEIVERSAQERGLSVRRMPSGAGHDAQMLARVCPSAMVFTPSVRGISHNPAEFTADEDLIAGCQVMCDVMLDLAATTFEEAK
jgi:N-carbamoyl-L-amino-acid hydrolase